MIKERYCDEPMARSKGLIGDKKTTIGKCKGRCRTCIACVEVHDTGDRNHVNPKKGE